MTDAVLRDKPPLVPRNFQSNVPPYPDSLMTGSFTMPSTSSPTIGSRICVNNAPNSGPHHPSPSSNNVSTNSNGIKANGYTASNEHTPKCSTPLLEHSSNRLFQSNSLIEKNHCTLPRAQPSMSHQTLNGN